MRKCDHRIPSSRAQSAVSQLRRPVQHHHSQELQSQQIHPRVVAVEASSLRAAAGIAGSLPQLLFGRGLLLELRNASSPRVDEPVADLFRSVSPLADPHRIRTLVLT